MNLEALLFNALAAWFVAFLLVKTDGMFDVFKRLRTLPHGGLLDCIFCTGFWVALVITVAPPGWFRDALAVGGAALLLHGFSGYRYNV